MGNAVSSLFGRRRRGGGGGGGDNSAYWINMHAESEKRRIEAEKRNEEMISQMKKFNETLQQKDTNQAKLQQDFNNLNTQINKLEIEKNQFSNEVMSLKQSNQQLQYQAQNLQQETKQKYQEYEQTMQKIKEEQQKEIQQIQRNMELENKKHDDEINELQADHKEAIKGLQKDSLIQHLDNLKKEKQLKVQYCDEKKITQQEIGMEYFKVKQQVDNEQERLQKFDAELKDKKIKQIVLIGATGNGKSTLGNRLCNDDSEDGDKGDFKVSDDVKSETQSIRKRVVENKIMKELISVVDTPGYYDTYKGDRKHCNNLIEFLRGCGGVNAFCVVKMIKPPRFDASYQQMMKDLERMLGRSVWQYIVLVITNVEDKKSKRNFETWSKALVDELRNEMNLNEFEAPLPIVGISNFEDYEEGIQKLKDCIPKEKYQCNQLRSPLDILKMEMDSKKLSLDQITNIVNGLDLEIKAIEEAIKDVTEQCKKV